MKKVYNLTNKIISHNVFRYILIFISLIFIYFFFRENERIVSIIKNADYAKIVFLIFLSVLFIFTYAYLTLNFLREICGIKIKTKQWHLIYFNSQFLSSIPFFGILYRAKQLKKYNLNYDKFVGLYITINWFFLFFSLIFFSIESYVFFADAKLLNIKLPVLFLFSAMIIFIVPYISGIIINRLIIKFRLESNFFFSRLQKLIKLFIINIFNFSLLRKFFYIFLIIHLLEFIVTTELIKSLESSIDFNKTFYIFFGAQIIDSLNFLPQNILISEIGIGLLTDRLDYDFELGVLIKLYMRFVIFFSSIFLAIFYNIYLKMINFKN
tara:strand:+ start:4187 stop:5158 length:972 start_codon:yes stop_codon:yes gene_type:complete